MSPVQTGNAVNHNCVDLYYIHTHWYSSKFCAFDQTI